MENVVEQKKVEAGPRGIVEKDEYREAVSITEKVYSWVEIKIG